MMSVRRWARGEAGEQTRRAVKVYRYRRTWDAGELPDTRRPRREEGWRQSYGVSLLQSPLQHPSCPLPTLHHQLLHLSYRGTPPRPVRRCLSLLPRPPGEPSVSASSTPQFNGQQRRPDAASRLRARVDPWRFERQCSVRTSEADSVCLRRVSVNPLVNPSSPAPRSCECN